MTAAEIADRVASVRGRIEQAAARAGRSPGDVVLVAVSKTFGIDAIRDALAAGVSDLGENRAQELRQKAAVVGARWHFVGPLQTNKVRHVVGVVAVVHSVDRPGLGEAIGRRARSIGVTQDVLIEVNLAGEATKHGVESQSAVALARTIDAIEGVRVTGLMAIPPAVPADRARAYFTQLAELRDEVTAWVPRAIELSMGMSHDFEAAVEEGATMVRVGEAIFGSRNPTRVDDLRIS